MQECKEALVLPPLPMRACVQKQRGSGCVWEKGRVHRGVRCLHACVGASVRLCVGVCACAHVGVWACGHNTGRLS